MPAGGAGLFLQAVQGGAQVARHPQEQMNREAGRGAVEADVHAAGGGFEAIEVAGVVGGLDLVPQFALAPTVIRVRIGMQLPREPAIERLDAFVAGRRRPGGSGPVARFGARFTRTGAARAAALAFEHLVERGRLIPGHRLVDRPDALVEIAEFRLPGSRHPVVVLQIKSRRQIAGSEHPLRARALIEWLVLAEWIFRARPVPVLGFGGGALEHPHHAPVGCQSAASGPGDLCFNGIQDAQFLRHGRFQLADLGEDRTEHTRLPAMKCRQIARLEDLNLRPDPGDAFLRGMIFLQGAAPDGLVVDDQQSPHPRRRRVVLRPPSSPPLFCAHRGDFRRSDLKRNAADAHREFPPRAARVWRFLVQRNHSLQQVALRLAPSATERTRLASSFSGKSQDLVKTAS